MKNNICIIMPSFFKYPNFEGCAVETLVSIIGKKNDEIKNLNITIVSRFNGENGIIKINAIDKLLFLIYRILKKLFKIKVNCLERYNFKVKKYIENNNFDYIIYEAGDIYDFSYIVDKIDKKKLIYHIHHDLFSEKTEYQKIIVNTFEHYLSVSDFCSDRFVKNYNIDKKNIYLLKNVTNNNEKMHYEKEELIKLKKELGFLDDDYIVIFAGRLIKEKGIKVLIEAIKEINNKKIKLLILGSSFSQNSKDTDFIIELKKMVNCIRDRIVFTGYINHSDIYKYYQIGDLVVIPSICEEAAGLVGIEAMKCNLPIICTKSGGMIEYLDKSVAIHVNKDNEKKLKNELIYYINNISNGKINMIEKITNGYEKSKKYTEDNYYNNFCKSIEYFNKLK